MFSVSICFVMESFSSWIRPFAKRSTESLARRLTISCFLASMTLRLTVSFDISTALSMTDAVRSAVRTMMTHVLQLRPVTAVSAVFNSAVLILVGGDVLLSGMLIIYTGREGPRNLHRNKGRHEA